MVFQEKIVKVFLDKSLNELLESLEILLESWKIHSEVFLKISLELFLETSLEIFLWVNLEGFQKESLNVLLQESLGKRVEKLIENFFKIPEEMA